MANSVYPLYKQAILTGTANTALNVDTSNSGPYTSLQVGYTFSTAHQFYSSISATKATGSTDQRITGGAPTVSTAGTFSSTGVLTYTAVPTGAAITAIVIYRPQTGVADATGFLVLYEDSGFSPITPNGGNITITWNVSGIFTISDGDLKENERFLGSIGPANVYAFNYRSDKARHVGLIAQEVERYAPEAVRVFDGVRRVNYGTALDRATQLAA